MVEVGFHYGRREGRRVFVLEDEHDYVISNVLFALDLLRIIHRIGQQCRDVEHDLQRSPALVDTHTTGAIAGNVQTATEVRPPLQSDGIAQKLHKVVKLNGSIRVAVKVLLSGAHAGVNHSKLEGVVIHARFVVQNVLRNGRFSEMLNRTQLQDASLMFDEKGHGTIQGDGHLLRGEERRY